MTDTVAQMTTDELKKLIESVIEEKLFELFGDLDEGLTLRKPMRDRLIRQQEDVATGERGEPLKDVVGRLELS